MRIRRYLTIALALPVFLAAAPAAAGKRARPPKPKAEKHAKGKHDGTALFEAMAHASRAGEMLEQLILDVQAAGDNAKKIKEISENYQTLTTAMAGEAEALHGALSKTELRHLEAYRRAKIAPLEHKWLQIMAKVEASVATEVAAQIAQMKNQIDDLLAESEAIIAQTRSAGGDSARRADLLQRMARLESATHGLYHEAAKVPGRKNAEALTQQVTARLEPQVRRADWLLRTVVLPPCPDFTAQVQALHKSVQELDGLASDYGLAVNRAGLSELMASRARTMAQIAATLRTPLTPEEASELKALAAELLGPVQAHLDEAQTQAEQRLGRR